VNIELDKPGYDAARDCPAQNCLVGQIEREIGILRARSGSTTDRVETLRFLIHFIADVHQPLHCADRHDRGGNETHVNLDDTTTNLHRIWDSDEVEVLGSDPVAVANRLNAQISAGEAAAWSKGMPADWCNQSFVIARDRIYMHVSGERISMSSQEARSNSEIAAIQLKRAGVRLAELLNRSFANAR